MNKCEIRLLVPSYGITTVEVEYTVNPIGSKQLYTIHGFHQTNRGERIKELDKEAVLSMNPYKGSDEMDKSAIEHKIIEATQGHMRRGLELDKLLPNPSTVKLKKIKRPSTLPE